VGLELQVAKVLALRTAAETLYSTLPVQKKKTRLLLLLLLDSVQDE